MYQEPTLAELIARAEQLDKMNQEIEAATGNWVGQTELNQLDSIYAKYAYDHEDWFSDLYSVEQQIEKLEALKEESDE